MKRLLLVMVLAGCGDGAKEKELFSKWEDKAGVYSIDLSKASFDKVTTVHVVSEEFGCHIKTLVEGDNDTGTLTFGESVWDGEGSDSESECASLANIEQRYSHEQDVLLICDDAGSCDSLR